ncbi:MAG: isoleucine--tRNA ligase [Gemmatimonadota bacterium]|nr:isoleucine--tRNA ligase [Gemmatimonadota bacterium]
MAYAPLDYPSVDALERDVLAQWERDDLFRQTLAATRDGEPFVFYEGPPTANGRPGIHHVFARTIKDLVCRYQTMRGRQVTRIAGWDTHGLPVEIEVEKALGISGKPDIERFGVAEFNRRCRESVFTYKTDWEALSARIGYWLEYDRAYVTYTREYIESVWWLLKQLHERELLYEGHKVLPYCPRCGTALSSHELAMGYATHRSPSIYVLVRLQHPSADGRPRHLLVWTTTPWTLPANVAVAVHPDLRYVELDVDGRLLLVERGIAETKVVPGATHGRRLAEFPQVADYAGRELVGWRYEPLLDAVPVDPTQAFRVVAGEFVTSEEGTGLVHIAPAFGADDYATVQRDGLAFFNPVDAAGRFTATRWEAINGRTVFEANPLIAARLDAEGKLFGRYEPEGHEHTYPFCWRCDSPLIYYARRSWFVRTTAFRERMLAINADVGWHPPEVGAGRFGEWLENNVDWALSRDRFWGTPLPAWRCETDETHVTVIGGYRELADRTGAPLGDDFDPHKPGVDTVTFRCTTCGGVMRRVPEVIDAWFDSGAMPYAQWHWPFEHDADFRRHFPADFICEGLDQTRGWFYSLLAIAAGLFDGPAFRHVIVNGMVLDAEGRKMSKRLGNAVDPWAAVADHGADTVRLYLLASSQAWLPKRFDPAGIQEVAGSSLHRLRNTYGFFALYAEDWSPAEAPARAARPLVDRWLADRVDRVVADVRAAWDRYDVTAGVRALLEFCDHDLSNWWVRINRGRFWAPDARAEPAALATLYEALVTVSRTLAPAAPFLSDALHRRLTGRSVHLERMPEARGGRDETLAAAMDAIRRLATLARAARDTAGLRVRQPLAALRVAVPAGVRGDAFAELLPVLAAEVNVKAVSVAADRELVRLRGKPNFRTLGKVYGKDTPAAAQVAAALDDEALRALEAGREVRRASDGREFRFQPEDVVVEREVATDWLVQSDGPFVVALDPTVTEGLRREGLAREVVNRIQRLRKEAGYEYSTRIILSVSGDGEVVAASDAFQGFIAGETLARHVTIGREIADPDVHEATDIDGRRVVIALKRHAAAGPSGITA